MKHTLLPILAGLLCLPVFAGDDDQRREEWMRTRDKEMHRAKESAQYHGDIESVEKRYDWLKEDNKEKYQDMIEKRKAAGQAWKDAAERIGRAKTQEEISALKIPAYKAAALAELAQLELKAAGSEQGWAKLAEKSDSGAARRVAQELIKNQRATIETTKAKLISEHQLRELSLQRGELENELREEYDKARQKERGGDKPRHDERPAKKEEPRQPPAPEHRDQPKFRLE